MKWPPVSKCCCGAKHGQEFETALRVADLELNLISREASRADQPLTLLPTEYKLLEFLMRSTGQILSRMMIFEEVWGYHFDPGTNLIDVHIGRLRKKSTHRASRR